MSPKVTQLVCKLHSCRNLQLDAAIVSTLDCDANRDLDRVCEQRLVRAAGVPNSLPCQPSVPPLCCSGYCAFTFIVVPSYNCGEDPHPCRGAPMSSNAMQNCQSKPVPPVLLAQGVAGCLCTVCAQRQFPGESTDAGSALLFMYYATRVTGLPASELADWEFAGRRMAAVCVHHSSASCPSKLVEILLFQAR